MAEVYFGARIPITTLNGDWANVTQWYATPGEYGGKNPNIPGTLLNRVANSATDTVYMFQQVNQNVGTYSGDIITGNFADPSAVWTGTIGSNTGSATFLRGTFTGNISGQNTLGIYGGDFSNATFLPGPAGYTFGESLAQGDNTSIAPYTLTLPNNFSVNTAGQVFINRQMNWTYPLNFYAGQKSLFITRGPISGQMPTITIDISTSATNTQQYQITGGGVIGPAHIGTFTPNSSVNTNVLFTNTNSLIFGSITIPAIVNLTNIGPQREITWYTGDGSSIINVQFPTIYDKLNIIQCPGVSGPAVISVVGGSNATWQPIYNLPMNNTSEGTKYKLVNNALPFPYGFGQNGTIYNPTVNIAVTKNIGAVLE